MKHLCFWILLLLLGDNVTANTTDSKVKVGVLEFNVPFAYSNSKGEMHGFYIDVFDAISHQLGINHEYVLCNTNNYLDKLYSGEIDVALSIVKNDLLPTDIYFTSPYITSTRDIIIRKGDKPITVSDLPKKRIIVSRGMQNHEFLYDYKVKYENFIHADDIEQALSMLSVGIGDCAILSTAVVRSLIQQAGYSNLMVLNAQMPAVDVSMASLSEAMVKKLDTGIHQIKQSGIYDNIYYNWFEKNSSPIIPLYVYIGVGVMVLIITFNLLFNIILRKRVAYATEGNELLNKSLSNALDMGKMSAWKYDIATKKISGIHGEFFRTGKDDLFSYFNLDSPNYILSEDKIKFASFLKGLIAGDEMDHEIEIGVKLPGWKSSRYFRTAASVEYKRDVAIAIHGVSRDVTDEKRVIDNLKESYDKMAIAIEAGNLLTWTYEIESKMFSVVKSNTSLGYEELLYTFDEYAKLIHDEDLDKINSLLQLMIAGETEKGCLEYRFNERGNWCWVRCIFMPIIKNDNIVSISGVTIDISLEKIAHERTKTEIETIKKENHLMHVILNSLPIPVHIKDPELDIYTFANKASEEIFNVSTGKSSFEVLKSMNADLIRTGDLDLLKTGISYHGKESLVFIDGRRADTHVHKSIIDYDGKRQILIARTDETETNKAMRASQILSTSLPTLKAFTWYYDSRNEHVYIHHNMKLARYVDKMISPEDFIAVIHPDDKEAFASILSELHLKQHGQKTAQYRADLEEIGKYEWWESYASADVRYEDGNSYKIVCGLSINIHDRKKAELEMMDLKHKTELVLQNTTSGLIYIDPDYKVLWSNVDAMFCNSKQNIYQAGSVCYQSKGLDKPCEGCTIMSVLDSGQAVNNLRVDWDGKTYDIVKVPVINDGEMQGVLLKLDDRTEHYQLLDEMNKAKEKAEQSDKLKSAFLANMSHEIRTPLNAIVGFSDLMTHCDDVEEREMYGKIIISNNALLLQLIDDILDLSKIEAGLFEFQKDYFELNKLFDNLYSTFMLRKSDNVELICHKELDNLQVYIDKKRLTQILNNFLSNAVKYTAQGKIEFGYTLHKNGIKVYVRDTGIGISEENKKLVFQRFQKFNDFAQGTGLGLSICKAISDSCPESEINFESQLGVGSYFWIYIPSPLVYDETKKEDAAVKDKEKLTGDRLKILITETIDNNYMLMEAILRGHELLRAHTADEAIEISRKDNLDLIFMDVKMPTVNGLHAVKEIRKFDTDTSIIALTANALDADIDVALSAGCNDFITKPLSKDKINTILKKWVC